MKRIVLSLSLSIAVAFALASCSGVPKGNGGGGGGGGGNNQTGSVKVTVIADTLPAHPSIISFPVTISSLVFTPTSGTATSVNLNPPVVVDLARVESDTALVGAFSGLAAGQYSSITAVVGLPSQITIMNDSGSAITKVNNVAITPTCPSASICIMNVATTASEQASVGYTVPSSGGVGVELDLNLNNIVALSAGNLDVAFNNASTLSAFALPRAGGANFPAQTVEVLEDITGVVSLGTNSVTITPATATGRVPVTASTSSAMILNADPSGTLCANPTPGSVSSCVSSNQAASMDVLLKSDGTLAVQEIEPLLSTLQDTVEGTVVSINSSTQFAMIVSDFIPAATNSRIGTVHIADPLTVNIGVNPNPFLVDTKGLPVATVAPGTLANFVGMTDTTPLRPGQTVAVHVTSFSAGSPAVIGTDTVTLRWSRFTATPIQPFTSATFNISGFPSYFLASGSAEAQVFPGPLTTQNITNIDGVTSAASMLTTKPVAVRALFIENASNSALPAFFVAKIRQH
ncbi:MAG TPA: hypothetical protein VJN93_03305 [Candidatus Acidoferrum sp.]|nr:hypothetical protein [Candidatus Acidoferrum sp.]